MTTTGGRVRPGITSTKKWSRAKINAGHATNHVREIKRPSPFVCFSFSGFVIRSLWRNRISRVNGRGSDWEDAMVLSVGCSVEWFSFVESGEVR